MDQAALLTRRALPACCLGPPDTSHLLRALGDASRCGGLSLDSCGGAELSGWSAWACCENQGPRPERDGNVLVDGRDGRLAYPAGSVEAHIRFSGESSGPPEPGVLILGGEHRLLAPEPRQCGVTPSCDCG